MSLVVDSSLTLAWYFPDEGTEATDALLRRRLPLASLDAALVAAAKAAGVATVP